MKKVRLSAIGSLFCVLVLSSGVLVDAPAQVFRNAFPPEEFGARRAQVFEKIGDGVAILEGTTERPGSSRFARPTSFST